jgi:Zn-dependent M28 family amino/carboxypeptidase
MKIKFIFLIFFLPLVAKTQQSFDFSDTAVERRIRADLYYLASDSLKGREAGTYNEIKARDYIVQKFKEIGLASIMPDNSYVQEFSFREEYYGFGNSEKSDTNKKKAFNVVGYIDNNAPTTVVIGGHYDHLGIKYSDDGQRKVYYGADDNASGTVGVIEIARYLKQYGKKNNNYIICAFSAEEKGLYGSENFVDSPLFDATKVNYMLDLDMVGRLGSFGDVLYVNGIASSRMWRKLLRNNKPSDFFIKKVPDGMDGSDDYPFYKSEIPVLFFITGLHKEYHTPLDTPDKINYPGEVEIIKYAELLIDKLDSMGKIKYKTVTSLQTIRSYMMYAKMYF